MPAASHDMAFRRLVIHIVKLGTPICLRMFHSVCHRGDSNQRVLSTQSGVLPSRLHSEMCCLPCCVTHSVWHKEDATVELQLVIWCTCRTLVVLLCGTRRVWATAVNSTIGSAMSHGHLATVANASVRTLLNSSAARLAAGVCLSRPHGLDGAQFDGHQAVHYDSYCLCLSVVCWGHAVMMCTAEFHAHGVYTAVTTRTQCELRLLMPVGPTGATRG